MHIPLSQRQLSGQATPEHPQLPLSLLPLLASQAQPSVAVPLTTRVTQFGALPPATSDGQAHWHEPPVHVSVLRAQPPHSKLSPHAAVMGPHFAAQTVDCASQHFPALEQTRPFGHAPLSEPQTMC